MHDNGVTLQKKVLQNLDIPYSYELAKRMEQYRSHPTLGYRPAGSKAEFETGEMLKTEMEKIGLSEVTKDAVTVDGWEFHKAALSYTNAVGETVSAELGACQELHQGCSSDFFRGTLFLWISQSPVFSDPGHHFHNILGKLKLH